MRRADAHAFLELAAERVRSLAGERLRALGPVDAPMARRIKVISQLDSTMIRMLEKQGIRARQLD